MRRKTEMKMRPKQITMTAAMLAICIISQLFKNISVFITGPVINACIILTVMYAGIACGAILSVITPVTAYFITGGGVMAAIIGVNPFAGVMMIISIMIGNIILAVFVDMSVRKWNKKPITGMISGSVAKALFMGIVIALIIVPQFLPAKMAPKQHLIQLTFSVFQLITALIGTVYALIISLPLDKAMKNPEA